MNFASYDCQFYLVREIMVMKFLLQGRERLVRSLTEDYRSRSPYVAYLVRSRQGMLTTIAHLDK